MFFAFYDFLNISLVLLNKWHYKALKSFVDVRTFDCFNLECLAVTATLALARSFNHFHYKHIHLTITVRQKIGKLNPNVASFDQKCNSCVSYE